MLPKEFRVPADEEVEQAVGQLSLDSMQATFDKPKDRKRSHLRPLYLKGYVNSKLMTKMLVDGGAVVNLMSYTVYWKLGMGEEDLI